ncbi:MAG TPA: M14-type cytosolic carboxypeptidase, partial [Bryobacteraceae bacterium]|nr:M14-type cytosolic carboxypeptidase [Bryobacteraceae bacterium]
MAPALILAATITVHTAFDGGSAGPVQHVGPAHLRVGVKGDKDQNGRNRQASWYFFEVRGAQPGQPLTIDMVDLPGEYNFKPNRGAITGDTPPLVSYDGRTWIHIDNVTYDATEPHLRLRLTPLGPKFRIAHTPPYTNGDLERLRRHALTHGASEEVIGTSPEGRPLLLWTIGTGSKTVWLMFRQHAWESGTSYVGEGAVHELLRDSRGIRWKVFPMCDPDGVAHGRVRFNARGFDLNRNWDTLDSTSMPEIAAQHAAVAKWIKSGHGIDLFLTLHNTETSEYLQGPPG